MLLYNPHLKLPARELRAHMTPAEKKLWYIVRRKQLCGIQFYRQKIIESYILDFYAPSVNLVIEIDGGYHLQPEMIEQDKFRDNFLQSLGLTTLRFTNAQVLNRSCFVKQSILHVIQANFR
jgi:very-short-patch-repair endonuclease